MLPNATGGPALVVLAGLPGVGKTTLARGAARRLGAAYLRVDTVEHALRDGGTLLALVKPQFEAGRAFVGKGGIVRDAAARAGIERAVREAAVQAGLAPLAWIDSPIAGGDGNREFFLQARRPARAPAADTPT